MRNVARARSKWIKAGAPVLVLLLLVGAGIGSTRISAPGSSRNDKLKALCARGERLMGAKLLDEAAVAYARANRERAACAAGPFDAIKSDLTKRSDAVEEARADRIAAARLPPGTRRKRREDRALKRYLAAFDLDVRSPGARRGLRALLRAQERARGAAFADPTCKRTYELLQAGLLFEARTLSGLARGSDPKGRCETHWITLLERRARTTLASSRGDALALAGDREGAFADYVEALEADPSSERALSGLRRLPAPKIPKRRSAGEAGWRLLTAATADLGPALRAIALAVVAVLVLAVWPVIAFGRRRANRRPGRRRRSRLLAAAVEPRLEVVAAGADAAEKEAIAGFIGHLRDAPPIGGRPAARVIEESPRPLDMMPAATAASGLPPVVLAALSAAGGEPLIHAATAARGLFVRQPDALDVRFVPGGDTVMEVGYPPRLGGGTQRVSAAALGAAAPADPRERRLAVARLLAERVGAELRKAGT